jgi:hypothetical protein
MASNVTRDHHNLRRNLKLNDNYISNDGGDEGIRIDDAGNVGIGEDAPEAMLHVTASAPFIRLEGQGPGIQFRETDGSADQNFVISEEAGKLHIATQNDAWNVNDSLGSQKFTIQNDGNVGIGTGAPDSKLYIDYDFDNTTAGVQTGLRVDVDRTGDVSSSADINYGQYTTVNATGASGGTITSYGHRIGVIGDSGGTSKTVGLHITVGSADTNYAIITTGGSVGIGEAAPQDTLEVNGTILVKDKLKFTQDDGDEYIDSLNDGYLDIDATTAIRLKEEVLCFDKLYFTQTDGNEYIDSLNDGYLDIDATTAIRLKADTLIASTSKLYFNDEGGEYISGSGTDMTITSGGNLNIDASGHVEFDGCGVGFDLETPTYDATDTDVNFINGNKQFVTFDGGNITDLNLIFPKVSGNFLLMLKQDGTGSRTVTNYKVWDRVDDSAASGSATVKFAGGSNPDLTDDANHVDILSFFYDCDNEIAYGVSTLDFQF